MKKLIVLLVFLCSLASCVAQYDSTRKRLPIYAYGYSWNTGEFRKQLIVPKGDTVKFAVKDSNSIHILNDILYEWTGYYWQAVSGGAINAHRGLTRTGAQDLVWGGTLDSIVEIDQANFQILFKDGEFKHGTGDFAVKTDAYSEFYLNDEAFQSSISDGEGVSVHISSNISSGGDIGLAANSPLGIGYVNVSGYQGVVIGHNGGIIKMQGLTNATGPSVLFYDPGTELVSYGTAPSGGGSGGRFGFPGEDNAASEERIFDQNGNGIIIHDGVLTHGTGDYISLSTAYSQLIDGDAYFYSGRYDGDITTEFTNTLAAGGQLKLQALMASTSQAGWVIVSPTETDINQSDGNIKLRNLIDSAQPYQVFINPSTWKITYSAAAAGPTGRFGVSGEDDAAAEDREFDFGSNKIDLINDHNRLRFEDGHFDIVAQNVSTPGTGSPRARMQMWGLDGDNSEFVFDVRNDNSHRAQFVVFADPAEAYIQVNFLGPDSRFIMDGNGNTWQWQLEDLEPGTSTKMLYWNPSTKMVTVGDLPGAVGVGGSKVFAGSGLNNVNDSTIALGGSLSTNATIGAGASFKLSVTGSSARIFEAANSSGGSGVFGSSNSGIGGEFSSGSGTGLTATSTSLPAQFQKTGSVTNTSSQIISLTHIGGTVANGFGAHLAYTLETSTGSNSTAGKIGAVWTDATTATRTSKLEFFVYNSAAEINALNLLGAGQIQFPEYGVGTFTGTAAYVLAVDATGKIIEVSSGSIGGAEVNTASATISTTTDFTLPAEAILQYVLVKPASSLTGFKIGITSNDIEYFPATPVTAAAKFETFDVAAHIPAGDLTIRISGITSSTQVKLVYKTLHE